MNHEKLNNLVTVYSLEKSSETFTAIYNKLKPKLDAEKEFFKRRYGLDEHDVQEICDDAILSTIDQYSKGKGNYLTFLRYRIVSRIIDRVRSNSIRRSREIYESGSSSVEDSCHLFDLHEDFHRDCHPRTEEQAIINIQRERDQCHLVSSLVAHSDDFTKKIFELFPSHTSLRSIAKTMGVKHPEISRALKKLSLNYDATRFGDIKDYLTA